MTDVRERLRELDERAREAENRADAAKRRARDPHRAGRDLMEPLTAYHRAIFYKQRQPDSAEELRLVRALLAEVERDGVSLQPSDPQVAAKGLCVLDHREQIEAERAAEVAAQARAERDAFAVRHADELAASEREHEFSEIERALHERDPEALRTALGPERHAPVALTSDDFATR